MKERGLIREGGTRSGVFVLGVAVLLLVMFAEPAGAEVTNALENWSVSGVAGWKRTDVLNGTAQAVTNTTGALSFSFPGQSMPSPSVSLVFADAGASDGSFAGDYVASRVSRIQFKLFFAVSLPDGVRVCLGNTENRRRWFYPVEGLTTGKWVSVDIPLDYSAGWQSGTEPTFEKFTADIRSVAWIGLRFQRGGSLEAQSCAIDDFMLIGWGVGVSSKTGADSRGWSLPPDEDADQDSSLNWMELLAGTDPRDPASILNVGIERTNEVDIEGLVVGRPLLQWESAEGRWYCLWRTEDVRQEFVRFVVDIPATVPTNTYEDVTATNRGPYYYKLSVEDRR